MSVTCTLAERGRLKEVEEGVCVIWTLAERGRLLKDSEDGEGPAAMESWTHATQCREAGFSGEIVRTWSANCC